ncbi:MAG: copper amine oxidase N-terminal domain-containing protein [bacterium]
MKTRKLLAMLVAVAMIVTMLPMVALAAPTEVDEVSATIKATAFNGSTITADVTYTVELDDAAASGGQTVYVQLMNGSTPVTGSYGTVTVAAGRTTASVTVSGVALSWNTTYTVEADFDNAFGSPAKATATLTTPANTSDYSAAGSSVAVNKTTVDAGQAVTFTVRFRDAAGLIPNQPVKFWVKSSRDAEIITEINGDANHASIPSGYLDVARDIEAITTNNSTVTFTVKSSVAGDATISIYKLDNTSFDADDALLIGKETITFKSSEKVSKVTLDTEDVSGSGTVVAGKRFKLVAQVLDGDDNWVSGEEVTFYQRYREDAGKGWGNWKKVGTAETDKYGEAKLSVSYDKAGLYQFYAKAGTADNKANPVDVTVDAANAYSVAAKDEVKYVEVDKQATVKFIYRDRYNSKVDLTGSVTASDIEIINPDGDDFDGTVSFPFNSDKELEVKFTPDEKGEYIVRAYIPDSGIYAETIVNTAEFGKAVKIGMKLYDGSTKLDNAAVELYDGNNTQTYQVKVFEYDKNDVERELDAGDVYFSTSDAKIATIDSAGVITLKKDASGVVTITAIHEETDLTGTLDITVAGDPVEVKVDVTVKGLEASVKMQFVDKNGNLAVESTGNEGYKVLVASDVEVVDIKDFKNGKASFGLVAEKEGSYNVRVVTDEGIATSFNVDFAEEKEAPAFNKVVLTIGANFAVVNGQVSEIDAPAFIEDGRTFVPVRFIAEAFGAEADWSPKDGPVEVVTLKTEEMEIVIGIGQEYLTINRGEESEIKTFDGAARIKDGRTYLPFRAIAEAFGTTVDYGTDAQGYVTWVSFE